MSIASHINRTVGLVVAGVVGGGIGVGYAAHTAFAPVETQQVSDVSTPADTSTPTETVTQTVEPSPTTTSPTATEAPKPSASPTSTYVPPATTTTTQEPTVPAQPEPTQPTATQPATTQPTYDSRIVPPTPPDLSVIHGATTSPRKAAAPASPPAP